MKIQLSETLQGHRRGRFLTGLFGLQTPSASETSTDTGPLALLITGEEFAASSATQSEWTEWAKCEGHALLLLPPYNQGVLLEGLDWRVDLLSQSPSAIETNSPTSGLATTLVNEISFVLTGLDGASDRDAGHLWRDGTINTRYWKSHANSGVLAATCLPLWSISLLGDGEKARAWLETICQHVGRAAAVAPAGVSNLTATPSSQQWAVLLCCYAYCQSSPDALQRALALQPVPTMRLDGYDLPLLFGELRSNGWLDESGLSDQGLVLLAAGPFWRYAEQLKELVSV